MSHIDDLRNNGDPDTELADLEATIHGLHERVDRLETLALNLYDELVWTAKRGEPDVEAIGALSRVLGEMGVER